MLERRIAARPSPPATVRDLEIALLEEWNSIPQSLIDNLIASMANRQYSKRNSEKIWWNNLKDIPMWLRRKAVAKFRRTTGPYCLLKHLHIIHVARVPFCTHCEFREDMDADYIAAAQP
ncbi:hypothetical protein TNCV_3518571 [Trichonephila clavipes]|uniref:Reverse transcriptase n=1 Tax=Trichonephila clavipes TaxID=2585209 RepID=A0A8X6SXW1_TRICX|nr:hypothetical protein TNCV_3518571 [Trichonephila clavipes]